MWEAIVTEREELARIIDPTAFALAAEVARVMALPVLDRPPGSTMSVASELAERQCAKALAKADQWLSRPSPVDELVAAAAAVVARWAMPQWKDAPPTASTMHRLNDALAAYDKARGETQ